MTNPFEAESFAGIADMDFAFATEGPAFTAAGPASETTRVPPDRLRLCRDAKHEMRNAMRRKNALEAIGEIPRPGTVYHVVSNGRYDFWSFVPTLLAMLAPATIDEFFGSTWIINRPTANELIALFDAGKIRRIGLLTGKYLKQREPAIFATLYEGLRARGEQFRACLNHAKFFTVLFSDGNAITCEASANFTENGNCENYVFSNDRSLFEFHKSWTVDLLEGD